MSERESPVEGGEPAVEAGPVALSRLLDEIRADARWRGEVAALRSGSGGAEGAPSEGPTSAAEAIGAALAALDEAIEAADAVVPIEPGRLVIGDAWARMRRQIHREIRIYQDRQATVNREVAAALRLVAAGLGSTLERLEEQLGAADALTSEIEPLGALRVAVGELEARLSEVERWRARG